MQLKELLEATDEGIAQAIAAGSVSTPCLLDSRAWDRIKQVCYASGRLLGRYPNQWSESWSALRSRRLDAFLELPDRRILSQLVQELVAGDILANEQCWIHICRVRGRNRGAIDTELWKQTCERRGVHGVPSGPYS